jgi:hypothetical protein
VTGKPTVSANFAASANVSKVDYDVGRAQPASGGPAANASLAYDAATDSFTLKAGTENVTFGPGDVTINSSNLLRYEKAEGNTTTQLTLDWGMRSEWTTAPQYVALGQLISRQRNIATGIDRYSSIDFAFGYPSEASAIPRSGSASYALSFTGTRSSSVTEHLLQMMGSGMAVVDFSTGTLDISGKTASFNFLGPGILGTESEGTVTATAAITSGKNQFTGTFTAQGGASDTYEGSLTGSFYGPEAQDIGGTLYGTSGPLFYSLAFAGYGLPETSPDDTLANLEGSTRLQTVVTSVDLPARESLDNPLGEKIIYDADTQTYTVGGRESAVGFVFSFGPANRLPAQDAGDLRAYGASHAVVDGKVQYSIGVFDGATDGIELTYASFMRVLGTRTDMDGNVTGQALDYIGFGIFTPPDQLPRSGSATYAGRLFGDIHNDTKLLASLTGQSELSVNFGAGTMAAALFPVRVDAGGTSTALGRYDFSGSIDAYASAFSGAWTGGTGSLVGRFYGDAAQEYAAVFNIQDPVAGEMTGISVGSRDVAGK